MVTILHLNIKACVLTITVNQHWGIVIFLHLSIESIEVWPQVV